MENDFLFLGLVDYFFIFQSLVFDLNINQRQQSIFAHRNSTKLNYPIFPPTFSTKNFHFFYSSQNSFFVVILRHLAILFNIFFYIIIILCISPYMKKIPRFLNIYFIITIFSFTFTVEMRERNYLTSQFFFSFHFISPLACARFEM